jgi:hypothetical protein
MSRGQSPGHVQKSDRRLRTRHAKLAWPSAHPAADAPRSRPRSVRFSHVPGTVPGTRPKPTVASRCITRHARSPCNPRRTLVDLRGERSSTAEFTDDPVPLNACRGDCDLTPYEPMRARVDGSQKSVERRHLGHESHRAAHGRAGRRVLNPDDVRPLASDGHPAAGITHNLDHSGHHRSHRNGSRTHESEYSRLPCAGQPRVRSECLPAHSRSRAH